MAAASGTDLTGYQRQLEMTRLFSTPAEGVEFVTSGAPRETMARVAEFSFDHGLLGPMAPDPGFVGIAFPDGSVWGSTGNVNLRFTDAYICPSRMAADGALCQQARTHATSDQSHPSAFRGVRSQILAILLFCCCSATGGFDSPRTSRTDCSRPSRPWPRRCTASHSTEDRRTGDYLFWVDTLASLERLALGVGFGASHRSASWRSCRLAAPRPFHAFSLPRGDSDGSPARAAADPVHRARYGKAVEDHSSRSALALHRPRHRGAYLRAAGRNAGSRRKPWAPAPGAPWRIVLPQILPRLLDAIRLSLGAAWLFLIAAEAIAEHGRARLSHLPRPPLSGHGRDPALRRLDHASRLAH